MAMFRQGSVGLKALASVTPVTGARAGTVNDAGGFVTNIDCRNYKNLSLLVSPGVVGTTIDCEIKFSATSGGSFTSTSPASSITQITGAGAAVQLDLEVPSGKPWAQIVLVTVGATTAAAATLFGHNPTGVNRQ